MTQKTRVGLLFGGKSAEHEVSLQSAQNIIDAIDKQKYEVVLIGIDKEGGWHLQAAEKFLLNATDPELIRLNTSPESLAIVPEKHTQNFLNLSTNQRVARKILRVYDVYRPCGIYYEDYGQRIFVVCGLKGP